MHRIITALLTVVVLCACAGQPPVPTPSATPRSTVAPTTSPTAPTPPVQEPPTIPYDLSGVGVLTPTVPLSQLTLFGYTYQKPNGNRLAAGSGRMTSVIPVDIRLDGVPAWVVGVPVDGGGTIWAAALTDGRIQAFLVMAGGITPISLGVDQLPPGMPPLVVAHKGVPALVTVRAEDASPLTHPIILGEDPEDLAYITVGGDLVVVKDGATTRLEVDALPDGRILQDPRGRLLVVTGASSRYAHGVLGDQVEGTSITLIETAPVVRIVNAISTGIQVFEGTAPIWCDLDDDGDWEIIATLADEVDGAKIVIFNEDGDRIAEGPPAGRGYLWRHLLAAAPFGGGSEMNIIDNLTPHIEGITGFYGWDSEDGLFLVSSAPGASSHRLASRNLDRVIAGDLDGDGFIEVLLPSQTGEILIAFRFLNGSAVAAWNLALGAEMTTNLAGITLPDGRLAIGFGLASGILRLYLP